MILDLDKLKASPADYDLYQIAYRRAGATTGVHDIGDISDLKIGPNLRFRLAEASIQHEAAIAADLIKNFVETSAARGYWSYEVIEVAIQVLGNKLSWRKVEPAPPPEPAGEVLEPWQLRIDATEADMKKADVKALKDLLARRRAATGQQYIGRGARTNRFVSNF